MVTYITNHSGQKTREETETDEESIQKFHPKMINSEIITEIYIKKQTKMTRDQY